MPLRSLLASHVQHKSGITRTKVRLGRSSASKVIERVFLITVVHRSVSAGRRVGTVALKVRTSHTGFQHAHLRLGLFRDLDPAVRSGTHGVGVGLNISR